MNYKEEAEKIVDKVRFLNPDILTFGLKVSTDTAFKSDYKY